jgi:diguanylate cyclase (GGDEF)-like protein/PAS domain S-box-containing protein
VDPATLRIIDANESTCVKLGYTREELLALRADIDISGPEAFAAVAERLRSDGIHTFETNYKRKDGVTFPAETTIRNIVLDRRYCVIVARDITERKRAEEEVHELQAQLRDQAVHDPLTGLFNRRYLDEELGRELIRATRSGRPVGMIMCDIDHFKAVNDTHGHLVGDQVLRAFAELLRSQTRGSDIVCRYGGEEVLLLLPDASRDATYQRAEQLRMALAAQPIPVGELAVPVTASFGVAVMPKNGATSDELIRAADEAMYAAKQAGRNRVVVAPARKGPSLAAWRAPDRALCADRFAGARYPVSDPSRRLHRLRPRREY